MNRFGLGTIIGATIGAVVATSYFSDSSNENSLNSITVYDESDKSLFLGGLVAAGIPHKESESGQIWYPTDQDDEVSEIFQTTLQKSARRFVVFDSARLALMEKLLSQRGIKYETTVLSEGTAVEVESGKIDQARELFKIAMTSDANAL